MTELGRNSEGHPLSQLHDCLACEVACGSRARTLRVCHSAATREHALMSDGHSRVTVEGWGPPRCHAHPSGVSPAPPGAQSVSCRAGRGQTNTPPVKAEELIRNIRQLHFLELRVVPLPTAAAPPPPPPVRVLAWRRMFRACCGRSCSVGRRGAG